MKRDGFYFLLPILTREEAAAAIRSWGRQGEQRPWQLRWWGRAREVWVATMAACFVGFVGKLELAKLSTIV